MKYEQRLQRLEQTNEPIQPDGEFCLIANLDASLTYTLDGKPITLDEARPWLNAVSEHPEDVAYVVSWDEADRRGVPENSTPTPTEEKCLKS